MIMFLAKLNGLEMCACYIGNAYLEAHTGEKVEFIAGPKFGPYAASKVVIVL
jgi:hypothetical protein